MRKVTVLSNGAFDFVQYEDYLKLEGALKLAREYIVLLEDHMGNQRLPLPHYDFCDQDILDLIDDALGEE